MTNKQGVTVFFPPGLNEREMKPFIDVKRLRN
jgi:hypothetical protein